MDFPYVDGLAVLAAAAASVVLGFVWFSKPLFMGMWLRSIGKSEEETKPTVTHIVVLLLATVLMAAGVGALYAWLGRGGPVQGMLAGVFLYIVTILPLKFADTFFESRPWTHFWLTAGFQLISFAAMGFVIGLMD